MCIFVCVCLNGRTEKLPQVADLLPASPAAAGAGAFAAVAAENLKIWAL